MDQTNLLPNNPRRLPSNDDPLMQASPGPWMVHPHTSPMSPWHAQSLPLGPLYFHQHTFQQASTNPGPAQATQIGQHSALPHPDRSLRALQNPDSVVGLPAASTYWTSNLQPMSGVMNSVPGINSVMNATSDSSIPESELGNTNYFSTRGLALQPPVAADWASPGVILDSLPTTSCLFPSSERPANVPEPAGASSSSTTLSYPLSPISPHHSTQVPPTSSQRTQRPQSSVAFFEVRDFTSLASPASDRRRQAYSRSRRSMSSRQSGPGLSRSQDEASQDPSGEIPTPLLPRPHPRVSDDMVARQMQMFRGSTMSSKLVASRAAVQSLESVEISSLPENEKACVICYNDYGVESPEGVNEAPLRLPPCKHIFGDHCIRKWLDESDSCPYCRAKLQAEPRHSYGSATTFINMMRMRGLPLPAGLSDELIARLAAGPITETELQELFHRADRNRERRPPPDDAATHQDQRRTRQRRSGPVPAEARFAGVGAMHPRSASDAPASQDLTRPREGGSWGAQTSVAGSAPPPQHRLQSRPVMRETNAQLNGMNERRGQSASSRTPRPTDPMAPVVVNGSSLRERSIPNPLQSQAQSRSVLSTPTLSGTIHASSLSTMENPTRQPDDAELSALRPSRNRPWW